MEVIHDVPEADRTYPCGTPMVEIGQDVSEQLDIVPMKVRLLRHIRKRYGCPTECDDPTSEHAPVLAALHPQPLSKSTASADFLAMLLAVKFVDGLPLARFENVLARHHAPVRRQTLAGWVMGSSGPPEDRHLARQNGSVPVLVELHAWMLKHAPLVTPKSALGTAWGYRAICGRNLTIMPSAVICRLTTTAVRMQSSPL